MSTPPVNPPMPVDAPPEAVQRDLALLLAEPFAQAWSQPGFSGAAAQAVRERLRTRLTASRQAEAGMFTTRRRQLPREALAAGVAAQTLYRAQPGCTLRPGEPLRSRLIELAPGARLAAAQWSADLDAHALHREWLVLAGSAWLDGVALSQRDYHVVPAGGQATAAWSSDAGALLFLRESVMPAHAGDMPFTVFDAQAGWAEYAPCLQRRVLWQRDGQAALLYFARPGAQVAQHSHGHDEECLMLQGELFLDDLLLQPGDYQLAPAGSGHRITATDTGVVIYAHGDLDLRLGELENRDRPSAPQP